MSADGQAVIEENSYISVAEDAAAFQSENPSGTLSVAGSSSVTPVMEKLKEAYTAINPNATIEVQQSDSSTGRQQRHRRRVRHWYGLARHQGLRA